MSPINPRANRWITGEGAGCPCGLETTPQLENDLFLRWMRGDSVERVAGYRVHMGITCEDVDSAEIIPYRR